MMRVLVLASALAIGACGGGAQKPAPAEPEPIANRQPATTPAAAPAPATEAQAALMKMREFGAQMCACADAACAKLVSDAMTAWSQEAARRQTEPLKMSEEETNAVVEIGTKMAECMQTAMSAGSQPSQP